MVFSILDSAMQIMPVTSIPEDQRPDMLFCMEMAFSSGVRSARNVSHFLQQSQSMQPNSFLYGQSMRHQIN